MKFPDNVDQFAVIADWHANTHWAQHILNELAYRDISVIIHLGDYGYDFDEYYLQTQNDILEKYDMLLMFIDGNHEHFDYLETIPIAEDGTRKITDRIWHLPRGFRWEWDEIKFLGLGGSISIDKKQRIPGFSWWEQEAITAVDVRKAINGGKADVVLTHDVPEGVDISRLIYGWLPEDIQREADLQRAYLREVAEHVQPTHWYHGHYHRRHRAELTLENGNKCEVTGLDCDGSSFYENVEIIDLRSLKNEIGYFNGEKYVRFL